MTAELGSRSYFRDESCDRSPGVSLSPSIPGGEERPRSRHQCVRDLGSVMTPQRPHRRPCPVHSRKSRAPSLTRELRSTTSKCPSDQDFSGLARQLRGLLKTKAVFQEQPQLDKIQHVDSQSYWNDNMGSQNEELGTHPSPCGFCSRKHLAAGEQTTKTSPKMPVTRRSSSLPKSPRRLSTMDGTQYPSLTTYSNQQTQTKPPNCSPAQNIPVAYQQGRVTYKESYIPSNVAQLTKILSPSENVDVLYCNEPVSNQRPVLTERVTSSPEKVESEGYGDSSANAQLKCRCGCPVHAENYRNDQCNDLRNRNYKNYRNYKNEQSCDFENKNEDFKNDQCYDLGNKNENFKNDQCYDLGNKNENFKNDQCYSFVNKNELGYVESDSQAIWNNVKQHEAEINAECNTEIIPECQQFASDICQPQEEKLTQDIDKRNTREPHNCMNVCLKLIKKKNGEICVVKDNDCGCGNHK